MIQVFLLNMLRVKRRTVPFTNNNYLGSPFSSENKIDFVLARVKLEAGAEIEKIIFTKLVNINKWYASWFVWSLVPQGFASMKSIADFFLSCFLSMWFLPQLQKKFWKFGKQPITFAAVLSKQLIKKGRGKWPCEALATLSEYSSDRRCQLHPVHWFRPVNGER